ncbi:hypothetical protein ACRE_081860 [Hapsidospora chrysogenum ATCC 11550]|uniref:Uncharacterized protein n=1 Tax=Hapsidospora chrysogenum (strain ATCC 11550 / CBS 779.69 / DSM 880 / IAM 14645 / JCM 23072 / IMI 49137) TaxID=857340 RepID=A0A086SVI6_HAPC1|nr:hypothetical protein ACRE_081860 [Hapsidospora chrysogenum ATCC 11550]
MESSPLKLVYQGQTNDGALLAARQVRMTGPAGAWLLQRRDVVPDVARCAAPVAKLPQAL